MKPFKQNNKSVRRLFITVLPVTLLSMFLVTKWWYALPFDGPDKMYWGFPLAFMGQGFHTSMSYQIFILELAVNFIIYLGFWAILILIVSHKFPNFSFHRVFLKVVWILSIALSLLFSILIGTSNPVFKAKRDYDWKIMKTGYVFIWQETEQPEYNQP